MNMIYKDYVNKLNELLENNPDIADMPVIASKDDEGNGYNEIYFDPSIVYYDGDSIYAEEDRVEMGEKLNTVLVN